MRLRFSARLRGSLVAGVLAAGWLSVLSADYARAGQDTVVPSQNSPVTADTAAAAPPLTAPEVSAKLVALLATAEQQITAGRVWSPPNDDASDTFMSILAMLPNASMSDLETIRGIPAHFAERARAATAAGRHDEAQAFSLWAEIFTTPPGPTTLGSVDQALLSAPGADTATASSHGIPFGAEAMLQPTAPPNEAAGRNGSSHEAGERRDVTERDEKSAETGAAVAASGTTEVSTSVAALLAAAEQQIADGHVWSPPDDNASGKFVSILAKLPNASISDLEIIRGIPAHFAERAHAANAAGQHDEAQDFSFWAGIFTRPPTIDPSAQVPLNAEGDPATASLREVPPEAEVLQPTLPPRGAARRFGSVPAAGKHGSAERGGRGNRHLVLSAPPVIHPLVAPPTLVNRDVTKAADEHCRAIVLKVQLGEEPSNADRTYLRQGCQQG